MLARLWGGPPIVPEHVHAKLADRRRSAASDRQRPYKVESFDAAGNSRAGQEPLL